MADPSWMWRAGGAVVKSDCPTSRCCCGKCVECGYALHTAIHGPALGKTSGSKPYGHAAVLDLRRKKK